MGKLADEARYDGISVLRTHARIILLQAVIRYRALGHQAGSDAVECLYVQLLLRGQERRSPR